MNKVHCYICGYMTLDSRCDWDICPICFWEDDILFDNKDKRSEANNMKISTAQANYMIFGAISEEYIQQVRSPNEDDLKDPNWRPLQRAVEIANRHPKGQ